MSGKMVYPVYLYFNEDDSLEIIYDYSMFGMFFSDSVLHGFDEDEGWIFDSLGYKYYIKVPDYSHFAQYNDLEFIKAAIDRKIDEFRKTIVNMKCARKLSDEEVLNAIQNFGEDFEGLYFYMFDQIKYELLVSKEEYEKNIKNRWTEEELRRTNQIKRNEYKKVRYWL